MQNWSLAFLLFGARMGPTPPIPGRTSVQWRRLRSTSCRITELYVLFLYKTETKETPTRWPTERTANCKYFFIKPCSFELSSLSIQVLLLKAILIDSFLFCIPMRHAARTPPPPILLLAVRRFEQTVFWKFSAISHIGMLVFLHWGWCLADYWQMFWI